MKVVAFFMSLLFIVGISGCHQKSDVTSQEQVEYSLGLQVFDENDQMLPSAIDTFSEYKIRKIKIFNLMQHSTSFSFLILLNGVPCSIKVNNSTNNIYHGEIPAETIWEEEVAITLDSSLLFSENNSLTFLVVAENQILPKTSSEHYLFYSVAFTHHLVNTPKSYSSILIDSNNLLKRSSKIEEAVGSSFYMTVESATNEDDYVSASNHIELFSNEKASVKIKMVAPAGLYSLLLFCDDNLVTMKNGDPYYHVQLGENEMFSKIFDIYPEKQKGSIYALAIPLTDDSLFSCSSQKMCYTISEKKL